MPHAIECDSVHLPHLELAVGGELVVLSTELMRFFFPDEVDDKDVCDVGHVPGGFA